MGRRGAKGLLALAGFAVLAGCADAADPKTASATFPASETAPPDTVGAINGFVVDDEQRPIPKAELSLVKTSFAARTDDVGRYAFEDVPPGTFIVAVLAGGYEAVARQAEVLVGETTWANFTLAPLPGVEPYLEVLPRTSFVDFAQRQLNNLLLKQLNATCKECKHIFHLDNDPYGMMTEFVFQTPIDYPIGSKRVCVEYVRNYTGDSHIVDGAEFFANSCHATGTNRTFLRDTDPACSDCVRTPTDQITMYISGQEPFDCVGCMPNFPVFQTRVEMWITIPHHDTFPAGWTAIPPS